MFFKQLKVRQFQYTPRFYKPEPADEEEAGPRIKFRRLIERKPTAKRSFWLVLILILVIVFVLRYFLGVTHKDQKDFKFQDVEIETIE